VCDLTVRFDNQKASTAVQGKQCLAAANYRYQTGQLLSVFSQGMWRMATVRTGSGPGSQHSLKIASGDNSSEGEYTENLVDLNCMNHCAVLLSRKERVHETLRYRALMLQEFAFIHDIFSGHKLNIKTQTASLHYVTAESKRMEDLLRGNDADSLESIR
jgi:hypothetical protein